MIKSIDKRLRSSPRRVRDFYSNVIVGVITGGIVGGFLTIVKSCSEVKYILPPLSSVLIFLIFLISLYFFGSYSLSKLTKNKDEIEGYKSNVQAGFFASLTVVVLLIFKNLWVRLLIILSLVLIFITILWFIAGRKK